MVILVENKLPTPTLALADIPKGVNLWSHFSIAYTDFQPNGTATGTITLLTRPALAIVSGIIIHHTASFTGGTTASATLAIGDGGGSVTQYSPARDVFTAPGDALAYESSVSMSGAGASEGIFMLDAGTADNFEATLTIGGDVIDNLTAGAADVWILWTEAPT